MPLRRRSLEIRERNLGAGAPEVARLGARLRPRRRTGDVVRLVVVATQQPPGSIATDDAVIIEGVDSPASRDALFSTVHGAGRIMSRTAAKGKFVKVGGKRVRQEGLVRHDEMMKWIADKNVVLRGGDLDEAPQAYRRLPDVLAAHAGTIRILHTLTPLGVAMAGKDIVDPYKD